MKNTYNSFYILVTWPPENFFSTSRHKYYCLHKGNFFLSRNTYTFLKPLDRTFFHTWYIIQQKKFLSFSCLREGSFLWEKLASHKQVKFFQTNFLISCPGHSKISFDLQAQDLLICTNEFCFLSRNEYLNTETESSSIRILTQKHLFSVTWPPENFRPPGTEISVL